MHFVMCFQFNLLQLVTCPAHIHGNTLDLMLTNNDDLLNNISVCSNTNNSISSDHYPIVFSLSHARPLPTTNLSQHVYDYSKANFPEINSYIFNSIILNYLHFCDVETSWVIIKSVIYEAMTLFIPKFRVYSKQYPKWFTKELCHQIKCLHTLRRNYKQSPSDHNATRLNQAENWFQINVDTAKSNYEANLINNFVSTSNPAIYRHIRSCSYLWGLFEIEKALP